MWNRYFSNAARQASRFSRRLNTPLSMGTYQTRFHANSANSFAWTKGMILGAGALGLTCAYLTKKAFALNTDSVREQSGY